MASRRLLAAVMISVAASACNRADTVRAQFTPVATVDQVMDAIVIPSSQAIFDAVVYENGELVTSPNTDDDWFALQMHAIAVAEAGNLLLIPPRAKEADDWTAFSSGLTEAAVDVSKAAEAKDVDRMLKAGSDLYRACVRCHSTYVPDQ